VALPLSLALDINNSKNVCNYDTAQAVHGGAVGCPSSTIVAEDAPHRRGVEGGRLRLHGPRPRLDRQERERAESRLILTSVAP
jgi:hypothetical protein